MIETRGVALFAYNTDQIDYAKLALLAARYVKRHMKNNNVCLITDQGTWDYLVDSRSAERADAAFDDVVISPVQHTSNKRVHYDSPWTKFVSEFKNSNKHQVIDYTPYDKTLLIDIDYIVQNGSLDYIFDTDAEVALFHDSEDLVGRPPASTETWLKPTGIPMLWSTVVYFDKHSATSRMFFDMWAHVYESYDFYKFLYGFSGNMYRTDFAVSIAAHLMNGMGAGELIDDFNGKLINMSQRDDIAKVNELDDWVYLVNNRLENWKDTTTRIKQENVHVMNKRSLERFYSYLSRQLDIEDGIIEE